jgi:hypothetical protein
VQIQHTSELHKSSNFSFKSFNQTAMYTKLLLIALSVATFSSCSTAYKSGQTPDDVYYSPVKVTADVQNNNQDLVKNETPVDYGISMGIHDPRWRGFNDNYDYLYSPYHYCTCNCSNDGYYYNPYYHPWPIYTTMIVPVNATPRMVNLNAYSGYNNITLIPKNGNGINWVMPSGQYNNTNRYTPGYTNRQSLYPSNNNSSSSNSTRTYTPSSNSGSSSPGSVSRPKRGG